MLDFEKIRKLSKKAMNRKPGQKQRKELERRMCPFCQRILAINALNNKRLGHKFGTCA